MDVNTIIGGVAPDGVLYLKTFLIDYKTEFNVTNVNPSCTKCLVNYHNEFIKKYNIMNNSDYVLKKKREGLPLHFGSSIRVNNGNITNEYALKLMERFEPEYLFDKFPKQDPKQEVTDTEEKQPYVNKKKRNKRK